MGLPWPALFTRARGGRAVPLQAADLPYVSPVTGAQVLEPAPAAMYAVYLMLAALVVAVVWSALAQVDIVAKANGRVVPDGREQVIASLEGGLLRELLVREGQQVEAGQALALLDPTRVEAQQAEGQARRQALIGTLARLQAESTGKPLNFPSDVPAAVVAGETESFEARRNALVQGTESVRRSIGLLSRELDVSQRLSMKGLMSEVEVMRLRRQINELSAQMQERTNRFRQEASAELVRVRTELSLMEEQMVVRDDAMRRSTLTSPVRGIVKQVRINTVGGVVAPGAPVMEILPLGRHVLVEARVRPADIGFVKVGQPVLVKLSAYEYTIYGGLRGVVHSISPDALGDPERAGAPDGTWYRALVRADSSRLMPEGGGARQALWAQKLTGGERVVSTPGNVAQNAAAGAVEDASDKAAKESTEKPTQAVSPHAMGEPSAAGPAAGLPVLPGMNGTVEIRTGQRSVLAFLLLPMLKSQEAFRER
jgi:membrane fusion protein, adhesin transport system